MPLLNAALRSNPEFQSALVRLGLWLFGASYIGLGAWTGYYEVQIDYYLLFFAVYLAVFLGMLISVLVRPTWVARQYVGLAFDITAVSLAIFLTRTAISPFYLIYIWIFISYGTRYGRTHLIVASVVSVVAYSLVLVALDHWRQHTFEAVFFLLLLIVLPLYQHSLLSKVRAARREAEIASKAKGDFLAVMTHELRTPLTGVIGMAHLLQTTPLTAEQREYASAIASSAEVLQALIGDVLDLSKIDARKLNLESIPFDLRATAQGVSSVLESQVLDKGLELILAIDPRVPARVIGDELRVRQILFNLVGNAIKFTERGEVVVRASLRPAEDEVLRPHILLEVEDTGIGIAPAMCERIFEGFCQADDSTTRRYGGTGLGTTIARELSLLMGGQIGVESELGKGSRFWVRLPLLGQETATLPAHAGQRLAGLCALVYEGNATSRRQIETVCRGEGMACKAVEDIEGLGRTTTWGAEANILIIADSPEREDLPGLLASFREVLGKGVPHLYLTYAVRRSASAGICGHCVNKPFLPEELIDGVVAALGRTDHSGQTPAPPAASHVVQQRPTTRVLVAEDNEIAAKVITALLSREGLSVTRVQDGEAALREAASGGFALALIDLRMPVLDGIAFARAQRAAEDGAAHLPIIALTANAGEAVREECLQAGMDEFLGKPVRPAELAAVVQRFLGHPRPALPD
jgi:two-component system sensor histidine kinase RpfC